MSSPIVTIIVPTYNYGHLISQTLDCILNQSFEEWEAIIVDDGSTDDTREVVDRFVKADGRFHYIHQSNSGVSKARNTALSSARGRFIQFLDADDLVSKEKLTLQVKYLHENPDVDVVNANTLYFHTDRPQTFYNDINLIDTRGREVVKGKGNEAILELIEHNPIVVHGPLFKKEILEDVLPFEEDMRYLEDWDFWLRIALANFRFDHLDHIDATAFVRVHAISASQNGTIIPEAEGYFRRRINTLVDNTPRLTREEKNIALKLNKKELTNTYKHLMAKTPLSRISRFKDYFDQLQNPKLFFSCLLKSLNLKRKMRNSRQTLSRFMKTL